jgi:hypothetical protein
MSYSEAMRRLELAHREFGQPGNLVPNIGSPLCDSASVASSCRTSNAADIVRVDDDMLAEHRRGRGAIAP